MNPSLIEILTLSLQRIRSLGFQGNATAAANEADHVHNLPELIETNDVSALRYYLEVERLAFLDTNPGHSEQFKPHWDALEALLP